VSDRNSATATLVSVLAVVGALALFGLLFTAFLLVPFFIFIVAIVAMVVSEWNRDRDDEPAAPTAEAPGVKR
jgi:uncharacterized membrane protein YhhN